jgi:peptidyl-prolyl cis-trans isomerase C
MNRFVPVTICCLWTALSAAAVAPAVAEGPGDTVGAEASLAAPDASVVIAAVGDEEITFGQINTMMNSSAVVGVSVPALGTPQRQGVAIVLLDKIISANLLYLDALRHGADKEPTYQRDVQTFSDGVIAGLYRKQELRADIQVSDQEIDDYARKAIESGTPPDADARMAIRSALRKQKLDAQETRLRERLRQGVEVTIDRAELDPAGDVVRPEATVVAKVGDQVVTWGEAQGALLAESKRASMSGGRLDAVEARIGILDEMIDTRIMAQKGRAAGLETDPTYQARVGEYRKTRLINSYRNQLMRTMEPTEEEIVGFYDQNKDKIAVREERKIQMVVLKTEDEARDIKKKIESGEMTVFEAARDYSIDPQAKHTLGEMGWVAKGSGFPALDEVTFSLEPDELGGPVKSPAGWHLVRVEDLRSAQNANLADSNTRKMTRRNMLRDRLDKYVVDLRLHTFKVEVHQDRLNEQFSREAAWIVQLEQKAKAPNSLTQRRTEAMEKLLKP